MLTKDRCKLADAAEHLRELRRYVEENMATQGVSLAVHVARQIVADTDVKSLTRMAQYYGLLKEEAAQNLPRVLDGILAELEQRM